MPINTAAEGELLRYFIDQTNSSWMVIEDEFVERLMPVTDQLPKVKHFLCLDPRSASESPLARVAVPITDVRELESSSAEPPPVATVRYNDLHLMPVLG